MRQDGWRGPCQLGNVPRIEMPNEQKKETANKSIKEARTCHGACILDSLSSQFSGHVGSRSLAKEKTKSLDDGHAGKGHTHRGGGTSVQLAHKKRIGHVVKASGQHT